MIQVSNYIFIVMSQHTELKQKSHDPTPQDTSFIDQFLNSNPHTHQPLTTTNSQQDFYGEFKRVLGIAFQLKKQHTHLEHLLYQLSNRVGNLQKNMDQTQKLQSDSHHKQALKKRNRRIAQQIERKHKCEVQFCQKYYGSEGSLLQHIKIKHPQIYSSKI